MLWTLAQMDPDETLAKFYWNLAMIVLVGLLAVVFFVAMFLLRRWKHRELKAIDDRREARRAGQAGGRVDAWAASSERYIDHDKLPQDDNAFDHGSASEHDDEPIPGSTAENEPDESQNPDEEDRDPYGLFSDKPYQDEDDDDDFDEDDEDDGDWDQGGSDDDKR